jgi:hypothetical protein
MDAIPWIQIRQYNDRQIVEFFESHWVDFRQVGDHLFIIDSRGEEVRARPGDWLVVAADGQVEVERGGYSRRSQRFASRSRRDARGTDYPPTDLATPLAQDPGGLGYASQTARAGQRRRRPGLSVTREWDDS